MANDVANLPISRTDSAMTVREWRARSPHLQDASGSEEPARKRKRAANALAMSTAMDKTPPQHTSMVSRAVSLTQSPGAAQPLPARGSVGNAGVTVLAEISAPRPGPQRRVAEVEAPRPRGGNDDFLRRVLRANGSQQSKKGGQLEPLAEVSDRPDRPSSIKSSSCTAAANRAKLSGPPGMRKALVDLAGLMDRKSRRV